MGNIPCCLSAFLQVRDLQNNFFAGLVSSAPSYLERYGSAADNPELEALPEEVALLLGDKDALGNALQVRALGQNSSYPLGAAAGPCAAILQHILHASMFEAGGRSSMFPARGQHTRNGHCSVSNLNL
jgi:hypothetical protein